MSVVLGLDPGFACIGYAVVELPSEGGERPINMGVFRTEKSSKKQKVFASDDNVRRAREIYLFLRDLATDGACGPVSAICAETMSFPRSSSVAAKMAMCWGAIAALSEQFNIPVIQASPQQLKKSVTGSKTSDKEAVQKALKKRYGKALLDESCRDVLPSMLEHPYDALGAVVATLDSELMRMARRVSSPLVVTGAPPCEV